MRKIYEQYHNKGIEVVDISLDEDKAKLESFIQKKELPWPQFIDGQGWGNRLAARCGVGSIPATFLLDGEGKIIAKELRGKELESTVAKALSRQ